VTRLRQIQQKTLVDQL